MRHREVDLICHKSITALFAAALAGLAVAAPSPPAAAAGPPAADPVRLVSAADPAMISDTANDESGFFRGSPNAQASADGRFLVYASRADNLVPGETESGGANIYLFDRAAGSTTLLSHKAGSPSAPTPFVCDVPVISTDGTVVAFASDAPDLVAGQSCANCPPGAYPTYNVFVYERVTGTLSLASHVAGNAAQSEFGNSFRPVLSADGRYLAFESSDTQLMPSGPLSPGENVFLLDRNTSTISLVSHSAQSPLVGSDGDAFVSSISADGGWVAFQSTGSDLVPGQVSPPRSNVFLYNRPTGAVTLVSHKAGTTTTAGNADSGPVVISADGSTVAYDSESTDLIAGQIEGAGGWNIFVFDRLAGSTSLVSHTVGSAVTTGNATSFDPALSADGRAVAFTSAASDLVAGFTPGPESYNLYLADLNGSGTLTLVSHRAGSPSAAGDGGSEGPALSADGRFLAFSSQALDLVPGQPGSAPRGNVYVYDRYDSSTRLVTHAAASPLAAGGGSAKVSGDGAFVYFQSFSPASALVAGTVDANGTGDLFVYDRAAGTNRLVTRRDPGLPSATAGGDSFIAPPPLSAVSDDGRFIAFTSFAINLVPGQTPALSLGNAFLFDQATGTRVQVSHAVTGVLGSPPGPVAAISGNGRYVLYRVGAPQPSPPVGPPSVFPGLYLHDRLTAMDVLVTHKAGSPSAGANNDSVPWGLSDDGRFVLFLSYATDLVPGQVDGFAFDQQVFLFDRDAGTTVLVSHSAGSPVTACNQFAYSATLSADGRYVAFVTHATDVVAGQGASAGSPSVNVFLFDRVSGTSLLVSHAAGSPTVTANNPSNTPSLSGDGRYVAFMSDASNLVPGQPPYGAGSIYLFDRVTGATGLVSGAGGSPTVAANNASYTPAVSADGRYVAFISYATDLIAGVMDTNQGADVYLYDRVAGSFALVSHAAGSPTTTADAPYGGGYLAINANGRFVAYLDGGSNLVAGQAASPHPEVYLYDRATGANTLVSRSIAGALMPSNLGAVYSPSLSAGGGTVVFASFSTDLVEGDRNHHEDVFAYNAVPAPTGDFFTVRPCRLLDTRQTAAGAAASGTPLFLTVPGSCGIPSTARAIAINVTATQPDGGGNLSLYPADIAPPGLPALFFNRGATRCNNAVAALAVDLGSAGTVALLPTLPGGGGVQVLVDVSGYFE